MDYYGPSKADRTERTSAKKRKRKMEAITRDDKQLQTLDLTLYGHPCVRHCDDTVAIYFHEERHLIDLFENDVNEGFHLDDDGDDYEQKKVNDLHGDSSKVGNVEDSKLYVDRYDVRMHMELSSLLSSRNNLVNNVDVESDADLTKEELEAVNHERYLDLPPFHSENNSTLGSLHIESVNDSTSPTKHVDRNVDTKTEHHDDDPAPLSLNHSSDMIANETKPIHEPFELKETDKALLPKNIMLPTTKRMNDIIIMTAKKAKENSQFEVLLKVKQNANPTFAFLDCTHELHAYYKWHRNGGIRQKDEEDATFQNGALQMMALYGSSSSSDSEDDDHDDDHHDDGGVEDKACDRNISNLELQDNNKKHAIESKDDMKPMNDLKSEEELSKGERQKRRLEKAKLLKDHFSAKQHGSC